MNGDARPASEQPLSPIQAAGLVSALRTCSSELRTLAPRLREPYRSNAQKCVAKADEALRACGLKP
jgi:hypothetical protein